MRLSIATIPSGDPVVRFTPEQRELALQISNDIAEGDATRHPVALVRMAVAYWADVAALEAGKRALYEGEIARLRQLLEMAKCEAKMPPLPPLDWDRGTKP
jgi:hypothetical protein